MVDRQKINKGLEHCCDPDMCNEDCPYYKEYEEVKDCTSHLAGDALELLKEQQAEIEQLRNDANARRCKDCKRAV